MPQDDRWTFSESIRVRVTPAMRDELREAAQREDRTPPAIVRRALSMYFDRHDEKEGNR